MAERNVAVETGAMALEAYAVVKPSFFLPPAGEDR